MKLRPLKPSDFRITPVYSDGGGAYAVYRRFGRWPLRVWSDRPVFVGLSYASCTHWIGQAVHWSSKKGQAEALAKEEEKRTQKEQFLAILAHFATTGWVWDHTELTLHHPAKAFRVPVLELDLTVEAVHAYINEAEKGYV